MNFSDLQNIDGLQFMPVKANKRPIITGWQSLFKKHDLSNSEAVGLVCGKLSGNLEVIDCDMKYDITGKMFERYKRLINEANPNLLSKLVVQKTQNKGYHLIYRCEKIEGNLKLANRPTTTEEKDETYKLTYNSEIKSALKDGETEEQRDIRAKNVAEKAKINDKVRVLFETRGEGGYIMCFPSSGYELIYRDYYGISDLTIEERETLHSIARQFNSVTEEIKINRTENRKGVKGTSSFEDYNERGDVIGLLEQHGWKIVGQKGSKTIFLRPGQTTSQSSGNFDHDKKWFSVFTTSTEFEPMHAYLPYAVFCMLECKNDFQEASKKLYELGYGERKEKERELNQKTPSKINLIDDDFSFLETDSDFDDYLQRAREGTLPLGLKTHIPKLDEHFLFKRGDMVMINGIDNVGKTIVILFLMLLASLYHGWKFLIFSCENTNRSLVRRLIEFYWGKKIQKLNDVEFNVARQFISNHFKFIKSEEELYNYKDILNMAKKALNKFKFDGGLIDPYNGLKIELTNASKLSTHEYHYEAISEIKQFGTKYDFSWFINNHAVTASLRQKDVNGFQKAPNKEDTEGGGKFSNKTAQFITIHRLTQHPKEWMITELHIRKVKENETGGKVTPKDHPVKIAMKVGGCGFAEVVDITSSGDALLGVDPIQEWHKQGQPIQQSFDISVSENGWLPYKNDNDTLEDELPF